MIKSKPIVHAPLLTTDITPFIDIIFIVIVFLLITANEPLLSLPIAIPDADKGILLEASAKTELTVTITAQPPYWHLEQQAFSSWSDFKQALNTYTQDKNNTVLIATDKSAPSELLLKLLSFLNQQEFTNAHIIMEQEGQ